jgi:hypothetical protein
VSETEEPTTYFYVPSWDGRPRRFRLPGMREEPAPAPPAPPAAPVRVVAVDLGLAQDYSAVCVSEARRVNPDSRGRPEYEHRVGHLARWPLHTPYRHVARDVARLCAALETPPVLVVDATGVGIAVTEMFLEERPRHSWWCPVTIRGGEQATPNGRGGWNVPKRELVSALAVASQNRRLAVPRALPATAVLVKEMSTFKARIAPSGHVSYEGADWRSGAHDDVLLATSLALWAGERPSGGWIL